MDIYVHGNIIDRRDRKALMMSNSMNILALPDEMLCAILNKLHMVDVFYSLVDMNERFDRLAVDSLYVHHLDLVVKPIVKHYSSSIDDQVLNKICKTILPRICNEVYKLTVEPLSLERVLGIAHYPHLYSLSLINFPAETLLSQLTGDTTLVRLLTHQITQLSIDSYVNRDKAVDKDQLEIFPKILSLSEQLCDLSFGQYIFTNGSIKSSCKLPRQSRCISSTLTKLIISVPSIDDCLYLLNEQLECLSTLVIDITAYLDRISTRENKKSLPQLKCFSLSSTAMTTYYDEQIVPLLRRMSTLEELTLFLIISRCNSTYIDGKQLHDNVLSSMTRLEKFSFCMQTRLFNFSIEMELPSRDDLRNSFFQLGYKNVDAFSDVTYVDHRANAHIYSLPYPFKKFDCMTSAFQGGKFDQVRQLIMFDRRPFEHRLFQIIARDFPVLQSLLVNNRKEQQVKNYSDKHITFSHLCELSLTGSHIDYAREFLSNENIALPRLTDLFIAYETLATVTNSFTDSRARLISSQITRLVINKPFVRPNNFHLYFPLL